MASLIGGFGRVVVFSAKPAVFVSYTRADEAWAKWIAWQLRQDGWAVHLQAWHSVPGMDFVGWMQEKLTSSDYVLAVLSEAYLSSGWGQAEWRAGYEPGQLRVIPVRVEECEPRALLAHLVRIDLIGLAEDEARRVLLHGARAAWDGSTEPDEEPPFPVPDRTEAPPPAEVPPFPGWAAPRTLFDRVARACRDRYPGVVVQPVPDASPVPYLVLEGDWEGERQCWPIGVVAHGLDDATVMAFHTSVHLAYESPGDAVESELVYAGVLVEPGLVRRVCDCAAGGGVGKGGKPCRQREVVPMIVTLRPSAAGTTVRFVHTTGEPPSLVIQDGTSILVLRPADHADGLVDAAEFADELIQAVSEWKSSCRCTFDTTQPATRPRPLNTTTPQPRWSAGTTRLHARSALMTRWAPRPWDPHPSPPGAPR